MAVGGRSSLRMSILKQLQEVLKVIFLTETKCKISFKIQLQKWGKKWMEISALRGGGGLTLDGKCH